MIVRVFVRSLIVVLCAILVFEVARLTSRSFKHAGANMDTESLKQASFLTIEYMLDDQPREFDLRDKQAGEILAHLRIVGGKQRDAVGLIPFGRVNFHFGDGRSLETFFVAPDRLESSSGEAIFVEDSFYQSVCKAASAHAGQPIDVLKRN